MPPQGAGDGAGIFAAGMTGTFSAPTGNVGIGAASPTVTLSVNGRVSVGVTTKTSAYTATSSDYVVLCDASAGAWNLTLPPAANKGQIIFKKIDSTGNACDVQTQGSDQMQGGGTTIYLPTYNYPQATLIADGVSHWYVLNLPGTTQ
jgi:hypothetical protein